MKNGQLPLSNLLGGADSSSVKTDPGMNSSFDNEGKLSEETDDEDEEGNLVIAGTEAGEGTSNAASEGTEDNAGEGTEGEIMEIELPSIKNEIETEDESEIIDEIQTPAAKILKLANGQGVQMS